MEFRNRRLTITAGKYELAADVPDGADLVDAEIELTAELQRISAQAARRQQAAYNLASGKPSGGPWIWHGGVVENLTDAQRAKNVTAEERMTAAQFEDAFKRLSGLETGKKP